MILFLQLLFLLWMVNFAPPLTAQLIDGRWNRPFDGGRLLGDGRPVFGDHKTIRGVLAGMAAGLAGALVMGFPWWLGLGAGILSMAGDLFSSFLKRRFAFNSGDVVPGLDQAPEGLFPFLLLAPYFSLSLPFVLACTAVFGVGALVGSLFLNNVLLEKPYENYPRRVHPKTRIRELISCQIITRPFHHILNFEDSIYYHFFMKSVFQAIGIFERGRRNALQIEVQEVDFEFPALPPQFDGYRILFLADLHLDGLDGLTEKLVKIVRNIPVDLCILGGDYRMETHGPFSDALKRLNVLIPEIRAKDGIVGILGNHDCIEIVEKIRELGVVFLINESHHIEHDGGRIWLAGVDDPHYFRCHNLRETFSNVPRGAFTLFLAHSNELYKQARLYSPSLYLCGHSHAGQIQIPPFGPLFTHSSAPKRMCVGRWDFEGMPGYTSGGVGVSGVPVRFNTRGEVTVITLRRAPAFGKKEDQASGKADSPASSQESPERLTG